MRIKGVNNIWRSLEIGENMIMVLLSICIVLMLADFLTGGFKPGNKSGGDDGSGWDFD